MNPALLRRRSLLLLPAAMAVAPAFAQRPGTAAASGAGPQHRMVQLVDAAAAHQELARDYTTGLRLAWALRAGAGAALPQLVTVPVDLQRTGALQQAVQALRDDPAVVATVGTVSDALAVDSIAATRSAGLRLAHIGPWMADARHDAGTDVLPLFPSRSTQLKHAVAAVRGMGIDEMAIVYPSPHEQAQHAAEIDAAGRALGLQLASLAPAAGQPLASVAERLARLRSGLVLFVGASAELAVLSQAMAAQRLHRFVLSLSDVDHATLQQMRVGAGVPLILTQVVPNPATSSLPVVADYRAALKRLYDEAPSPLSLAGMLAGLCALEVYRRSGAATAPPARAGRVAVLAELQRRAPMDLGGFRLDFANGRRGSGFVTHTLLRTDGSLVG